MEDLGRTDLFFIILGAVLGANMLTVAAVYCFFQISKKEKEGTEQEPSTFWLYAGILMVCGFLFGGLWYAGVIDNLFS